MSPRWPVALDGVAAVTRVAWPSVTCQIPDGCSVAGTYAAALSMAKEASLPT